MKNENLTQEDIDSKWRDNTLCDGSSISQKQLQRDRDRILELYGIVSITPLETKFKMPKGLTAEEFFEDCFGVFRPDDMKTERITIRAYGDEMYYIDTKPLHHSQVAIGFLDLSFGSCDFQLYLKPTNDFIGFLLSRAERIEVLEPLWLRKKLQSSLKQSAKLYEEMEAEPA